MEERVAGIGNMGMRWRAALVSLLLFGLFVGAWHLATLGSGPAVSMDPEYAKLDGRDREPGQVGACPVRSTSARKSGST